VYAAVFSPDGKRIASASHDGTIRIWDAETNICLHTLTDHNGCVYAAMFSPDSKYIASASEDKTVRIWDAGAGVCLYTLQDHTHWVGSVSFSPDGKRIASASLDNTVRIWQDYNCLLKKCPQELIELFDKARISWQKRKPYRITVNEEHIINKYDQHSVVKLLKDERLFIKSNKQKCCIQ
jgi:WD40 repeat protein